MCVANAEQALASLDYRSACDITASKSKGKRRSREIWVRVAAQRSLIEAERSCSGSIFMELDGKQAFVVNYC